MARDKTLDEAAEDSPHSHDRSHGGHVALRAGPSLNLHASDRDRLYADSRKRSHHEMVVDSADVTDVPREAGTSSPQATAGETLQVLEVVIPDRRYLTFFTTCIMTNVATGAADVLLSKAASGEPPVRSRGQPEAVLVRLYDYATSWRYSSELPVSRCANGDLDLNQVKIALGLQGECDVSIYILLNFKYRGWTEDDLIDYRPQQWKTAI